MFSTLSFMTCTEVTRLSMSISRAEPFLELETGPKLALNFRPLGLYLDAFISILLKKPLTRKSSFYYEEHGTTLGLSLRMFSDSDTHTKSFALKFTLSCDAVYFSSIAEVKCFQLILSQMSFLIRT